MIFIGVELEFGKFPKVWWWDLDNCAIGLNLKLLSLN